MPRIQSHREVRNTSLSLYYATFNKGLATEHIQIDDPFALSTKTRCGSERKKRAVIRKSESLSRNSNFINDTKQSEDMELEYIRTGCVSNSVNLKCSRKEKNDELDLEMETLDVSSKLTLPQRHLFIPSLAWSNHKQDSLPIQRKGQRRLSEQKKNV